jgi:CRISPR-associated protein Cmr5
MNKNMVNNWIAPAVNALKYTGIANEKDEIVKTFRGQISTFGTAVVMGSLKSAVAFFAGDSKSDITRENLLRAMYYIINDFESEDQIKNITGYDVFKYVCANDSPLTKEKFINASIALKLAMNFYTLVPAKEKNKRGENGEKS